MAPWQMLVMVVLALYATFSVFRFTFRLIDRTHERMRREDLQATRERES